MKDYMDAAETVTVGTEVLYRPGEYSSELPGIVREKAGDVVDIYLPGPDIMVFAAPLRKNSHMPQGTWVPLIEKRKK